MTLNWESRELHVTRLTHIAQAEIEHDGEEVLFQIKPHTGAMGAVTEGLELLVRVYIPGATQARMEQIAQLLTDALYE